MKKKSIEGKVAMRKRKDTTSKKQDTTSHEGIERKMSDGRGAINEGKGAVKIDDAECKLLLIDERVMQCEEGHEQRSRGVGK
jgi:hypothetical protein